MPVTAKLSRHFYERLGEQIANELVDWFNAVDATYRSDLREVNELNFARFDAKVEQRFAEQDAKFERRLSEQDSKFEKRFADFEVKIERRFAEFEVKVDKRFAGIDVRFAEMKQGLAEFETKIERKLGDQTRFFFVAWSVLFVAVIGLWFKA